MPTDYGAGVGGFTPDQLGNAAVIYRVGIQMGMTTRDIQIALITAMVESNLRNVSYGDRDSVGLFQQRPSQGWGSAEQIMNPEYSARKFFSALRALGDRRFEMGMGQAAQAVQRSAFPERYAERIPEMRRLWPRIEKVGGGNPQSMDGGPYQMGMEWNPQAYLDRSQVNEIPPMLEAIPQMGVPDASQMLAAWGMTNPLPETLNPYDPETSGIGTFIGQGTNQVIQQISEQQEGTAFGIGVNGWRKAVIQYAKTAVGTPYVWGGTNLANGVDCSGLIYAAFLKAGMNIPRVSYAQANFGTRMGLKGLRPGDLWAWDNSSRNNGADHVALYLGNGMILEAARPGTAVRIRRLDPSEGGWGVHLNF